MYVALQTLTTVPTLPRTLLLLRGNPASVEWPDKGEATTASGTRDAETRVVIVLKGGSGGPRV